MTEEEIRKFLNGPSDNEYDDSIPGKRNVKNVKFQRFKDQPPNSINKHNYDFIKDVKLNVIAELGSSKVTVKELLGWDINSIIGLNKLAGETIDIYINEQQLATGEVIVINDSFGVRITELNNKVSNKKAKDMA